MDEPQIEKFLKIPLNSIVATNRTDGPPQISPTWFLYDEGLLYIGIVAGSAKHHNLKRDPRIGVCIDGGRGDPRAVMIYGTTVIIENEEDPVWQAKIWPLTRRYFDSDEEAQAYREEIRDLKLVMLVITPEKIISQNFGQENEQ